MITSLRKTIKLLMDNRAVLWSTTVLELNKRYSGSLLGPVWIFLYPILFLCVYLFLYLVIFKVRYPEFGTLDSIIYIFTGLVPYIAFMESVTGSAISIKQNMHLIKNVILPIEMIPMRMVLVSLVTQMVGLALILALGVINHSISWHLFLFLPIALFLQTLFLVGLAFLVAPLGVMLPDTGYFINILILLLMFISPIGFMGIMLAEKLRFIIDINPIYYLLEPFRITFLSKENIVGMPLLIGCVISFTVFVSGCVFFQKFKMFLVDYE